VDEIWKPVAGWEGHYEVSDQGRVRSIKKGARLMTGIPDSDGYLLIKLSAAPRRKLAKLHRLVAIAFIPNEGQLPEVNHKDGNKANNRKENLEWSTTADNLHHMRRVLGKGSVEVPVLLVDRVSGEEFRFKSQREASKSCGLTQAALSYAKVNGKTIVGRFTVKFIN
jgi:NUMOD4 motif/HNH endonuclease